jgi:hypothetical protein
VLDEARDVLGLAVVGQMESRFGETPDGIAVTIRHQDISYDLTRVRVQGIAGLWSLLIVWGL